MATTVKITRDWERDGYLIIENAQTLNHYLELCSELNNHEYEGIGFAFTNEQFEHILSKLRPQLKEGEKIIQFCSGGFATPDGYQKMLTFSNDIHKAIAEECDPQEVYYYEYNNYECCIGYEGDTPAIQKILKLFGEEKARKIKRYNELMTIDQLLKKK